MEETQASTMPIAYYTMPIAWQPMFFFWSRDIKKYSKIFSWNNK